MSYDHLLNVTEEPQEEISLRDLAALAKRLQDYQKTKAELEDNLSKINSEITRLSQQDIPQKMGSIGVTSITLDTGEKVAFKEKLKASIVDPDKFYDFLDSRGDGALMKIQLEIGKVPQNILSKIIQTLNANYGLIPTVKKTVHYQTLNKYLRDLCGIGGNTVAEIPLAELDSTMVTTFPYYETSIK